MLYAVWFEPTDVGHVCKLTEVDMSQYVTYTSPNYAELMQMAACLDANSTAAAAAKLGLLQIRDLAFWCERSLRNSTGSLKILWHQYFQ